MGIYDPDAMKVIDVTYIAGQEPWQKNLDNFRIDAEETENQEYQQDWTKWHGFFRNVPDYRTAMLTFVDWVIGSKELIMDARTKEIVRKIRGNGKQSFRMILKNHYLTSVIGGDSVTEIIKDKARRLKNLMIRDPGTMKIIANRKGRITEYKQMSGKQQGEGVKELETLQTWQPEEIWHTMNNPIADEIHGIPESESMQDLIKSLEQIQKTYAVVLERYMKPTYFFEADTDDDDELATIATKLDKSMKEFTNVVLPKGTLDEIKTAKIAQFSILDPVPWMNFLSRKFNKVARVPEIIQGESRESAVAGAEINFIGFKEYIMQRQTDFSENIKNQLGLDVTFPEPRELEIEQMQKGGSSHEKKKGKESNN